MWANLLYGIGRANPAGNHPLLVETSLAYKSSSLFSNFSGTHFNFGLQIVVYISKPFYL